MTLRGVTRASLAMGAIGLLGHDPLHACSVCFGQAEGPMIDGARMGVWLLFGLTLLVQGAFAAFFVNLYRRAKAAVKERKADGKLPGSA